MRTRAFWFVLGVGALGCNQAGHDALRPATPNVADARGGSTIKAVEGPSSVLVVDWKAEQRADLEEAIHDGIAVLAWNDQGLRLLKGCTLSGSYGYLPVQVKKDVVRLETADDVKASLPMGGLGIAAKIGGGFEQGTTLDIALAMVGKRRTTWHEVTRDDLSGNCAEATHYVRAVLVGAFAMKTGTKSKAAAAVEIFGMGTSGGTSSANDIQSVDGKVDACDRATGEEAKPPTQCTSILRLELEPISAAHAKTADKPAASPDKQITAEVDEGCPQGFVFSQGACKKVVADRPHTCAPNDAADCEAQCQKGDAASCDRSGSLASDATKATAAFQKGCDGGYANSCANLGLKLLGTSAPSAATAWAKGCQLGSARACSLHGELLLAGAGVPKDPATAVRSLVKGCDGGDYLACTNAGFLYAGGGGGAVQRDDAMALALGTKACFGGEAMACGNAGYKIELGQGTTADPKTAMTLYKRACKLATGQCFRAGLLLATGAPGLPKDDATAKGVLESACNGGDGLGLSCVVGAAVYQSRLVPTPSTLTHTMTIMKPQCDQKDGRACTFLGIAEYGMGKKPDAATHLKAGCDLKDNMGCELGKTLK